MRTHPIAWSKFRLRAVGALAALGVLPAAYAGGLGFVGSSNALTVNLNSTAVDVRGLLHIDESVTGRTLTWSQSVAPSHGVLAFSGATASSGSTDIAPGGTITYTPTAGFSGTDSFTVQASDGSISATRTIAVTFLGQGTAGSQFVAVGDAGTLLTSPDAATWTSRTSGTTVRLRGATASGNLIVAVGQSGTILTSPDGITWTARTSGVTETLRGVAASPTRFVAVGGDTTSMIRYSDGGTTWTSATVANLGRLRAVAWGGSQFVVVGPAGALLTSPDGVTWTQQNSGSTDELDGVVWNGTKYVVLTATGKVLTSTDGVTWTSTQANPPSWVEGLTWSDTQFVTVGGGGKAKTSPDGTTWTWQTSGTTNTLHGVAWTGVFAAQTADPVALTNNLRKLTISGITAANKVYDGAVTAVLNVLNAVLNGVNSGDTVTLSTTSAAGAFSDKTVANSKTVTTTGFSISGTNAADYTLVQPSTTANITAAGLTITGVTANNKTYDAGTTATLNTGSAALSGVVIGDTVTLGTGAATGAFADKTVANGKTVTASGFTISGTDAANYTLTQPTTTASITAASLTVTGVGASNKTYDGTTTATLTGTPALTGVITGDTVTLGTSGATGAFADRNVGTGKSVTVSGYTIGGTDAGNYALTQPTGITTGITAKTLTASGLTASNKTYDGTAAAALSGTAALATPETAGAGTTADGLPYSGDTVSVTGTASGAFGDRNVGTGKTVTVSGLSLTGTQAGNYALGTITTTANISAKPLSVTGLSGTNRVYDGTTTATLGGTAALLAAETAGTGATTDGAPYAGDTVAVGGTPTATFASKDVANGLAISVSGFTLSGAQASNYSVTQPTGLTANITAKTLTASGVTAANKVYDGTMTAPLSGTAVLPTAETAGAGTTSDGKPYSGDTVSVTGTMSGVFGDQNVGTSKTVTVSGLSLTGAQAADYALGAITTTANISAKPLTVTGLSGTNRVYDGTTTATLGGTAALLAAETAGTGATTDGAPYAGDTVAVGGTPTATFASKDVANGLAISVSGFTLSGAQASNYSVTQPTGLTANITAKTLTVSGVTAANKVYDGTTTAALSGTAVLPTAETAGAGTTSDGKPYSGDTVSLSGTMSGAFADKNAGTGKTITVTGLTLGGAQAGDYLLGGLTVTADITAKPLSISGLAASNKVYDGTTTAALTGTAVLATAEATGTGTTADGLPYVGDTVTLGGTAAGTFASKVVANGVAVTVSGITLTGAQAGNYSATQPTGLTANITAKGLTVSGVTANSKAYDGGTSATLNFGSAALVGVVTPDTVTLTTTSAAGAFADANVGSGKAVTITGLALGGADSGNYTLTQPSTTAAITPAAVTVTFGNLFQTYTGSAKSVIATASPSVATSVTYNGSPTAPTNAGSYPVTATVINSNYSGSASATLTILPASQTVAFTLGTGTIGATIPLSATASSGLPVTYSIVSGSGAITGSTLSITGPGSLTVRATQAGNSNYLSASTDATISNIAKLDQTISFGGLSDKRANDAAFTLNATASSGLPVTFTVSAGPVMLAGNTVTPTGASGSVTIRASQPGNAVYNAAPDVTQTFNVVGVSPFIYFGAIGTSGIAAQVNPDGKSGTLIGTLPGTGEGFVVTFTLSATGDFVSTVTTFGGTSSTATTAEIAMTASGVTTSPRAALSTPAASTDPVAASSTGTTRTFRGNVSGGVLVGSVDGLNTTFSAALVPATGPTAAIAGYYQSSSLDTAAGSIYSVVGTTNQVYVLAVTPTYVGGSSGTATNAGTFSVQAPGQATITGSVDAPTTTVTGSLTQPGAPAQAFSGLAVTTIRTDRLINLSSRGPVSGGNNVLIAGFVIGGSASKTVLLRGVGPGLKVLGVPGALANPSLQLYDSSGKLLLSNSGWGNDATLGATFARVGAFAFAAGSSDAAMTATLAPGAYTMVISNAGNDAGGVALAEIYDASANPSASYQRLVNISARGTVGTGANVLFGGFVVTGNSPKKLLIRGIGPGLAPLGVSGALTDPQLQVFDNHATLVAQNDNWSTPQAVSGAQTPATAADLITAANATGAFALGANSKDAALIVTLPPGQYTTQLSGVGGATGTAMVEIYEIPTN